MRIYCDNINELPISVSMMVVVLVNLLTIWNAKMNHTRKHNEMFLKPESIACIFSSKMYRNYSAIKLGSQRIFFNLAFLLRAACQKH